MQGPALLKDYWTSLKVKADDLFDLVKSDLALLDPYLALPLDSEAWLQFISLSFPPSPLLHQLSLVSLLRRLFKVFLFLKSISSFVELYLLPHLLWLEVNGAFRLWEYNCPSHRSSLAFLILFPPPLSMHTCYTYAYMESGRVSWGGDGWLEAGCLLQRRAEIHNLWRRNPAPALLGKSCKSLRFSSLLVSLLPDHTWRYIVFKRTNSSK